MLVEETTTVQVATRRSPIALDDVTLCVTVSRRSSMVAVALAALAAAAASTSFLTFFACLLYLCFCWGSVNQQTIL
jgi:hypothetical protein